MTEMTDDTRRSASPRAEGVPTYADSLGYSLAMRVMQSELYPKLAADERAECDEFIHRGQSRVPQQAPARTTADQGSYGMGRHVPTNTAADAPADPTHVFDPGYKSCHGTGRVCVGYSGREDDGNAPIIEQCDCFWPVSAEGVERALEEIARLEGELRALATIPDAPQQEGGSA